MEIFVYLLAELVCLFVSHPETCVSGQKDGVGVISPLGEKQVIKR